MPLALMTMSASPGTRADRLPLVHATNPWRGSSRCSRKTSSRRAARASVTGLVLLRAQPAQEVHDVVAAAPEVVVEELVALVEAVVGFRAALVGAVDVAADLAHRRRGGMD